MRGLKTCLLAMMLLVPAAWAEAAPIGFGFTLDFTTGTLAGQSFQGSLSVEGDACTAPGGLCDGEFAPDRPLTLLSFDVAVGGFDFAMTNDQQFPDFPRVIFSNDVIVAVDYQTHGGQSPILRVIPDGSVIFFDTLGTQSDGTFSAGSRVAMPEPASLALLALGLAAFGARRRSA